MDEKKRYDLLLADYRSIWNNRSLSSPEKSNEEIVNDTIKRELLDENSHPRVRKNRYEKYYSAIKRIVESDISTESQVLLIKLHNQIMDKLNERSD